MSHKPISRRTFLRGSGIALALPALEIMLPSRLMAAPASPLRFISIYFANGFVPENWNCTGTGTNFTLSPGMAPLANYKNDITVIHGLRNESLDARHRIGDKSIDHQHGPTAFLTGLPYDASKKLGEWTLTEPGRSIDQEMGAMSSNPLRVYVLGVHSEGLGNLPIRNHISWESQTVMAPRSDTSQKAFVKLFGSVSGTQAVSRLDFRKSILDFIKGDASRLQAKLGAADRLKLEEYFNSIREIERRIDSERQISCTQPNALGFNSDTNPDNAAAIEMRTKNMIDLMVIAIQCDQTRVCSFMLDNEENNTRLIDHGGIVREGDTGHHFQSHFRRAEAYDPAGTKLAQKPENMLQYTLWQTGKLAYLLGQLKAKTDSDGTPLLDHTMLLYGSAMGDADKHEHTNVPVILAGKANGLLTQGRLIRYTDGTPRENLLLSLLQKFELGTKGTVSFSKVGLSSGALNGL